MQEINIKLWRNNGAGDWSIAINALRHEHVCAQETDELNSFLQAKKRRCQ
jgi:hypothetical protein